MTTPQFESIPPEVLSRGLFGLEKEALRVNADGTLALTPHPKALGDPLTDPHVTLDFSESQIELITSPHSTPAAALQELDRLHVQVAKRLDGEYMWPFSMPCRLPEPEDIPIARFGDSPAGKMREHYRLGLANRYGKPMQMLCGIHFNFSFDGELLEQLFKQSGADDFRTFVNEAYLKVARYLIRKRWILVVLFGASPRLDTQSYCCPKMAKEREKAISLRLSRCGYSNPKNIEVDYNTFEGYISDLRRAVNTPQPEYAQFGDEQLNDHLLQIANEYYFPVRLKSSKGSTFLDGLEEHGVEYLELRIFDVNPLVRVGLTECQMRFTQLVFLHALFSEVPGITQEEIRRHNHLQEELALKGQVLCDDHTQEASDFFDEMKSLAEHMGPATEAMLAAYRERFLSKEQLPWKDLLDDMGKQDFLEYGIERTLQLHNELTQDE